MAAIYRNGIPVKYILSAIASSLLLFSTECARAKSGDESSSPDDFAKILSSAFTSARENRLKLRSFVGTWRQETKVDGFTKDHGKYERGGEFQMWIDGDKMATVSAEDRLFDDPANPGSKVRGQIRERRVYNGADFRALDLDAPNKIAVANDPEFRQDCDWRKVIGWHEDSYWPLEFAQTLPNDKTSVTSWSIEDGLLIFEVSTKGQGTSRSEIDLNKGCCLVKEQWFSPAGRLYMQETRELNEVAGDVWFPVATDAKAFDWDTGKLTLHHRRELDLAKCGFNDSAAIPEGTFDLAISPEMEVLDHRGLEPVSYTGRTTPLSKAALNLEVAKYLSRKAGINASRIWIFVLNGVVCLTIAAYLFYRRKQLHGVG